MKFTFTLDRLNKTLGKNCPCRVEQTRDNLCPCTEFLKTGKCICGLFKKIEDDINE